MKVKYKVEKKEKRRSTVKVADESKLTELIYNMSQAFLEADNHIIDEGDINKAMRVLRKHGILIDFCEGVLY
ncbi:MAG: hypothetical protein ACRDD7_08360 [Peptostreptococcaceae bacterium]